MTEDLVRRLRIAVGDVITWAALVDFPAEMTLQLLSREVPEVPGSAGDILALAVRRLARWRGVDMVDLEAAFRAYVEGEWVLSGD